MNWAKRQNEVCMFVFNRKLVGDMVAEIDCDSTRPNINNEWMSHLHSWATPPCPPTIQPINISTREKHDHWALVTRFSTGDLCQYVIVLLHVVRKGHYLDTRLCFRLIGCHPRAMYVISCYLSFRKERERTITTTTMTIVRRDLVLIRAVYPIHQVFFNQPQMIRLVRSH